MVVMTSEMDDHRHDNVCEITKMMTGKAFDTMSEDGAIVDEKC